ncbi:hypothetical protein EB061_01665 [bacterium]|jgi:biopolymer transport protein ExbD|nr:hypothetical protein [bacterium]
MHSLFKHKKKKPSDQSSLQITSMADIFTIILVALLKSSASGISTVTPSSANLPVATGKEITQDTLKVEINREMVTIDDKKVLDLRDFEIPIAEPQVNGISQAVYQGFLEKRNSKQETNAQSSLLVLADENVPYSTLKAVMAAAANTGFVDLQFVVVEDN